jgi:hypothetical protein
MHMATKQVSGRAAGGIARAASLSPAERSASARTAALAKAASRKLPFATHGSVDHPLELGDVQIPCYVLDDGTRVLSFTGLISALGISRGSTRGGDTRLVQFVENEAVRSFLSAEVIGAVKEPIKFTPPHRGRTAYGYQATLLADLCEGILAARTADTLTTPSQLAIAKQCEILVRGFARVGIVALVDEVTGYQRDRSKDELARILRDWVAKELQPYVKMFPADFVLAPQPGLEPGTYGLTVRRSTN